MRGGVGIANFSLFLLHLETPTHPIGCCRCEDVCVHGPPIKSEQDLSERSPPRRSADNFLSPEKNDSRNAQKVKAAAAKRRTKITIALACSRGAACSLKSSRDKLIQQPASFVFRRHARRGAAHAANENRFTLCGCGESGGR